MAIKGKPVDNKRSALPIFIVLGLCCFFYILGAWQRSGFRKGDSIAMRTAVSSTQFDAPYQSRDYVPYVNAPYKSLTVEKAIQNWIQYEGNVFRFPGGGTQFPHGADAYINDLAAVIPIDSGIVRTALDTGCGVASWGDYLLKKNVIAMSFAPRDSLVT